MKPSAQSRLIVMGASAGGVEAILEITRNLPAGFAAPVLVVQHIGAHHSCLPELVGRSSPNNAVSAKDGDRIRPGTFYFAPPDHHMMVENGMIRLSRGPKENHARPAINPLFRSAALAYGANAIGVVLTGRLDDGTAGLRAIKDCGGIAVVQDPADAQEPSMPESALAVVEADHVVPLSGMASLLSELATAPAASSAVTAPENLRREQEVFLGKTPFENLAVLGEPSGISCPDCGGTLFESHDKHPVQYLCHTGHVLGLRSLAQAHAEAVEYALWASLRVLQEKELILQRLAEIQATHGDGSEVPTRAIIHGLTRSIASLRRLIEEASSDPGDED